MWCNSNIHILLHVLLPIFVYIFLLHKKCKKNEQTLRFITNADNLFQELGLCFRRESLSFTDDDCYSFSTLTVVKYDKLSSFFFVSDSMFSLRKGVKTLTRYSP